MVSKKKVGNKKKFLFRYLKKWRIYHKIRKKKVEFTLEKKINSQFISEKIVKFPPKKNTSW